MGTVPALPASTTEIPLTDAFLSTIAVRNTRKAYTGALGRMVTDLGPDSIVGALTPERVAEWFTGVWGRCAASTFNARLTAINSACTYWQAQGWLTGDPLVRLRPRPMPADRSRAAKSRGRRRRQSRSWSRSRITA